MRAIFLFLLVANIVFFTHHFFFSKKSAELQSPVSHAVPSQSERRLELLSENGSHTKKRVGPKVNPDVAPQEIRVSDSANLCTMVGPYEQLLHAEYLVERLRSLGTKAQITSVEIKEGDAYWVYLPPEMSEKEALRRLYELQKKNVESYVITKGELANGISFGRYADRAEAELRLNEIKGQGYDAQIKTFPKTISETWVVLESTFAEKIDETTWLELLGNQQGLEKRQNFCLGVASE